MTFCMQLGMFGHTAFTSMQIYCEGTLCPMLLIGVLEGDTEAHLYCTKVVRVL